MREAGLTFPIVGLLRNGSPAAARDLDAFTNTWAEAGALMGMEVIDANWRRFRLVRLNQTPRWRQDQGLEPLAPGSLEATRQLFIDALDADPWRFTQEFNRADHNRERARIRRSQTTAELGRGFQASPFDNDYVPPPSPPLSAKQQAAIEAEKVRAARDTKSALVWLPVLYAPLAVAVALLLMLDSHSRILWLAGGAAGLAGTIKLMWRFERLKWFFYAAFPAFFVSFLMIGGVVISWLAAT